MNHSKYTIEILRGEDSSGCRGSGACMSALWLCEHRHNYCVYKAELLLLLNYWGGGVKRGGTEGGGEGE